MSEPDDRALEQYLHGDSKLSRLYREASRATAPPDLDETVLARARAEVRRRPRLDRVLAPVALAASLVLAVNLAWNVWQAEPAPAVRLEQMQEPARAPARPAPAPESLQQPPGHAAPATEFVAEPPPAAGDRVAGDAARARRQQQEEAASAQRIQRAEMEAARRRAEAERRGAMSAATPAAPAAAAPEAGKDGLLTEAEKIERLIAYLGALDEAVFVRNGTAYSAADAAHDLRRRWHAAGERVRTADDFIRVCAAFSSQAGEAYLIRFPDGRTRTAEDVLREHLRSLDAAAAR